MTYKVERVCFIPNEQHTSWENIEADAYMIEDGALHFMKRTLHSPRPFITYAPGMWVRVKGCPEKEAKQGSEEGNEARQDVEEG